MKKLLLLLLFPLMFACSSDKEEEGGKQNMSKWEAIMSGGERSALTLKFTSDSECFITAEWYTNENIVIWDWHRSVQRFIYSIKGNNIVLTNVDKDGVSLKGTINDTSIILTNPSEIEEGEYHFSKK